MNLKDFLLQLRSWRLWVLLGSIVVLTVVHQLSGVERSRFQQVLDIVPYLPIMLGALWFGLPGALSAAVLTATCYATHLVVHEPGSPFDPHHFHRTLNIAMYLVVGLFTGLLSQRQLTHHRRQKELAEKLEASYAELCDKTEALFRAEEQVRRANRLSVVGELATGLAHEVGNPLGGIKGAAEILADRLAPDSEEHRFATLLLKESKRLDTVVSRFLDSMRPGPADAARAAVPDVVETVVSLSKQTIRNEGLEIEVDVAPDLPEVAVDPQQLHQVLLNLLLNAVQATPRGGTISIRAARRDGTVECAVEDSGRGIDPEALPRIFDPFFTGRPGGVGLGLAITHRIVESCGGRIHVESEPGEGATFTVTIPAADEGR